MSWASLWSGFETRLKAVEAKFAVTFDGETLRKELTAEIEKVQAGAEAGLTAILKTAREEAAAEYVKLRAEFEAYVSAQVPQVSQAPVSTLQAATVFPPVTLQPAANVQESHE